MERKDRKIRKANMDDLQEILGIYEYARNFMAAHGNPDQWGDGYPQTEIIKEDIRQGKCHVCVENERTAGVFYFAREDDPSYRIIENGRWKNEDSYSVVHRIASAPGTKGIATFCLNWAVEQAGNVRIDTHDDNVPMQNLLRKLGFSYCGRIYLRDGSPRIAFQKDERIIIRTAEPEDAAKLLEIYAPYVEETAVTFEYSVPSEDEFRKRICKTLDRYPYLVALQEAEPVGYAYAGAFKERAAYDWAVESSIYVKMDKRNLGIGRRLYETLESVLGKQGILNVNACIACPKEEDKYLTKDSIAFHEKQGYRMAGRFVDCGYKFGRWYDMVWMEKHIGEHKTPQPPVTWFSELKKRDRDTGKMRYKVAVFDLDGTILDTLEDLADSLNYALRTENFPERTVEETRRFVGNGIRKLIERAVPAGTAVSEIDKVFGAFKEYYKEHCMDKTRPYEGIPQLFVQLKNEGCRIAVVSNKADFAVKSLCSSYFPGLIDLAVGEREGIKRKPCPDSLWEVLQVLGAQPREAIYIGDSEVDIETAENAGIDSLIVDWGFRERRVLEENGAKEIVSSPEEIYRYIRGEQ